MDTVLEIVRQAQTPYLPSYFQGDEQSDYRFALTASNSWDRVNTEAPSDFQIHAAQSLSPSNFNQLARPDLHTATLDVGQMHNLDQIRFGSDSGIDIGFHTANEGPRANIAMPEDDRRSSVTMTDADTLDLLEFVDASFVSLGPELEALDSQWTSGRDDVADIDS